MKVLIVVPAYNEESSVGGVISDLKKYGYKNICIVDDGSRDRTALIAKKNKVTVLSHPINRGLGAALGTGFEYARIKRFDYVVTFDADGQHKAIDIKKMIKLLMKFDVVIGSRLIDSQGMPLDRKIINWLANIMTYFIYKIWTTDSQSGLRGFNQLAINSIKIKTDKMEVSSEFFKEIKRNKLKFVEVPIQSVYTEYSRKKGQSNLNAFNILVKMLIRLFH